MVQSERWGAFCGGVFLLLAGLFLLNILKDRSLALSVAVLFLPTLFLLGALLHQIFHVYAFTAQSLALLLLLSAISSAQAGQAISRFIIGDALVGWMFVIPFFLTSAHVVLYLWGFIRRRFLTQHLSCTVMQLLSKKAEVEGLQNEILKIALTPQEIEASRWSPLGERRRF